MLPGDQALRVLVKVALGNPSGEGGGGSEG